MKFLKIKNNFIFFAVLFFSLLFTLNCLFAYDEIIVHPNLTLEMAKMYNFNYSEKVTEQEIEWMKKGSKDEDDRQGVLIRSNNHFYNPFGIKKWVVNDTLVGNSVSEPKLTSKEWAHDSLEQDSFPGGDFTWERAIWDYANGDKQHAYESLGHVLHLIEDSTVPAHVRNDLHISPGDKDLAPYQNLPRFEEIKKALQSDGEPYEAWTGAKAQSQDLSFDFADKLNNENKKPIILSSIDEYFTDIAKYANTKFFSKDTIYAYSEPKSFSIEGSEKKDNGDIINYVYGLDENNKRFKLASLQRVKSDLNSSEIKIYTLKGLEEDIEDSIHSDYWSRLAPRAVLTGAGIIKLFKDEANKAVQNPQSIVRPKSIASVYGRLTPTVRVVDPTVRQITTIAQLQGNAEIYIAKKALSGIQDIVVSTYNAVKSSAIAFYDWGKTTTVAVYNTTRSLVINAFNTAKTTTITVFNKTKTGLQLTKEYAVNSASSAVGTIGDFFSSKAGSIFGYFTSTAKAQLEFDISKSLPNSNSVESIIKQIKVVEVAQAAVVSEPLYSAKLIALKNKKSIFSPGEEVILGAQIKNTGTATWQGEKISLNVYVNMDLVKKFYYYSWLTGVRPASLGKVKIAPGETGTFSFIVMAPLAAGDYYFRVRPVWQSENSEFNWLSEEIASWHIKVQAPAIEIAEEKIADLPIENKDQAAEMKNSEENISIPEDNFLPEADKPADEIIEKEKLAEEAQIATETVRMAKEKAVRLREEEEVSFRRRRAVVWMTTVPETTILEFPENPTFETTSNFKFSSSKGGTNFLCSLREVVSTADEEFVSCGEYTVFEKLVYSEYILKVKAKDDFGNIDSTPAEFSWTIKKLKSAPHLVISEIQAGTEENSAEDEFVELYNPTDEAITLNGWELRKKNSNGAETNLVDDGVFKGIIAPKSFFLIAHKNYKGSVVPDLWYSANSNLSYENNSIILYDRDYQTGAIVDKIVYSSIPKGKSLERKAIQGDICISAQGKGEFLGNGCVADNEDDFESRLLPNPQNSANMAEPVPTPVHNIDSGLDYPTIQWAIDKAIAGDEIHVDSGIYYENVNINKRVLLKGIDTGGGKPVVDARGSGNVVIMRAEGSLFEGFKVTGSEATAGAGIFAFLNNNIIKNNDISDNFYGIYLQNSNNNIISDNIVNSNVHEGIFLMYSNYNAVNNNIVSENFYGIVLGTSNHNMIMKNGTSFNMNDGLYIVDSYDNEFAGNTAESNGYGIFIFSGGQNKIYHNNFIDNSQYNVDDRSGISNIWDNDYPDGGNYWSDYNGVDMNNGAKQDEPGSDNIGDMFYGITCNNFNTCGGISQDRYPLMNPLFN